MGPQIPSQFSAPKARSTTMKMTAWALTISIAATGAVITAGLVSAQGQHRNGMMGQGMMGRGMGHGMMGDNHGPGHKGNPIRHRIVRHGDGVPKPYAGMKNPLKPTAENVAAGEKLFADNCASCHGKSGEGDGEAGREMNPKPANLAFIMDKWIATDGFLMWSMAEGGTILKTAMPEFKDTLSEKQRWQVVNYLREEL
jgi:mono/diheme cytochrome c family protein